MLFALVLVPVAFAGAAFALTAERASRVLLVGAAAAHLGLSLWAVTRRPGPVLDGWLEADAIGLLFLLITSVLFFASSVYGFGYLQRESRANRPDWVEGVPFSNLPHHVFVGCMLLFLGAMTLVPLAHHLGLLWVAVEATTLASAPLIYFHRHHRSLEATWKYLLVASVGIALALLGTLFLGAAVSTRDAGASLVLGAILAGGAGLDATWLRAGFVLLLVGYGTKMGLAPFHTWLPDAHSEAPSLVSALMSGALLNCAFVALLRYVQVLGAAGDAGFGQGLLMLFGLISMAVAGAFVIGQRDYKRLLAYSSVEHMGIAAFGIGLGGLGAFGALFHALNHSLAKGLAFLVSGNVLAAFRTTSTQGVRGMVHVLPVSGVLWLVGFLALVGVPPFGTFFSEFTVLQAGLSAGHRWLSGLYLGLLVLAFLGIATVVLRMAHGPAWGTPMSRVRESWLAVVPPTALAVMALGTGLYLPEPLRALLTEAAALLGGAP